MEKNVDEMEESELKKELEKLYKKMNDLDDDSMEDLDFNGKMIIEKKNSDGEVVETRKTEL